MRALVGLLVSGAAGTRWGVLLPLIHSAVKETSDRHSWATCMIDMVMLSQKKPEEY